MPFLTGFKDIPCADCESEKRKIEEDGKFKVISCQPIDGQNGVPPGQRVCRISWQLATGGGT